MQTFIHRSSVAKEKICEEFKIANPLQFPFITKIVINMGLANYAGDTKKIQAAVKELSLIALQRPVVTYAKKSIAGFKLREGQQVGCKVTLRNHNMQSFFDRLVVFALPRVRDFRGLSLNAFDGNGNYSLGIKEHIVFPEIDYDKIESIKGMDICIVTSTSCDKVSKRFLELMGLPFRK
ncbi:MAG: 50S ribosomal protein L5 [Rickettsiales bacterium]